MLQRGLRQSHIISIQLPIVENKAGLKKIADNAWLSLPTVKDHVHALFCKLDVTSRIQLIALTRSGVVHDLLGLRSALKSEIENRRARLRMSRELRTTEQKELALWQNQTDRQH